jgi:hypothetical protein
MDVHDDEEHRGAVRVRITQQPAEVDVAHDAFHALESEIYVGRIVHREHDAGQDLEDQRDPGERAEVPPVVQIARRRVVGAHECVDVAEHRQPVLDPAHDRVGVVRPATAARTHLSCSPVAA